jgi:hypothetical protein
VLLGRCLRVANFRELRKAEVRRTPIPRTRVNYRWGPSFSNSLPLEIMAPLSTAGNNPLFSYISSTWSPPCPDLAPCLEHLQSTTSPYPPLPALPPEHLRHQGPPTSPCDALIHFLRFLRFLRNGLGVKTSHGGRWLDRVNAAHAQSKSSTKLLSLCSTQPHIRGPPTNPSLLLWRGQPVCRGIL